MTSDFNAFLAIGAGLFALGAMGFLTRRNMILMILSTELMLHGIALTLVTFSHMHGTHEGQAFTIFVLTVTACDAGLALSLILGLYQMTQSLDVSLWTQFRESDLPPPERSVPVSTGIEPVPEFPCLPPAGRRPDLDEQGLAATNCRYPLEGPLMPAAGPGT